MFPESAQTTSPLTEKFPVLYELLTGFAMDAAELRANLKVRDDATRAVFGSLSRITGFSDQLQLILTLMREDVRVVEELSAGPMNTLWSEQFDDCFYKWLRSPRAVAAEMN